MTFDTTNPYVLARDEGEHHHFLNHLATIKVAPGSTGSMTAIEFVAPRGFGPPVHSHHFEDELLIILEGEVEVHIRDEERIASCGQTAWFPHGVAHTFQVLSNTARFMAVTASRTGHPQFDQMVTELGTPASVPELPEPTEIDPGRVAEVCSAHGIDVLGPPPAPRPETDVMGEHSTS
ncbi:MAG: cupin domain-containing protein [Acidimicrobiales bacterium]|nr:cupin domain-containing protein [Acidimicrobiales bacterium]